MSEHDGLTAEQEAEPFKRASNVEIARWPLSARHAYANLLWATEREKARTEAAEARVKYLEGLGSRAQLDMLEFERSERHRAEARVAELRSFIENWAAVAGIPDAETYAKAFKEAVADYLARVLAPTTEAVTEVEGS